MAKEIPAKLLSTAAAEGLIHPVNATQAARTNGGKSRVKRLITRWMPAAVFDLHGNAAGGIFVRRSISEPVVWRFLKSNTEFLQRIDRRNRFLRAIDPKYLELMLQSSEEVSQERSRLMQMPRTEEERFRENMINLCLLCEIQPAHRQHAFDSRNGRSQSIP